MAIPEKILNLIDEQNYDINISDYVSRGFDIIKKNLGLFIGFGVIMILAQLMGQIPIVGVLISFIVGPVISAGGYYASEITDKNERPLEFGDFFKGFQNLGQLIAVTLVMGLIIVAALIPGLIVFGLSFFVLGDINDPSIPLIILGFFLMFLPAMYLAICYSFAVPFLIFENLEFWDALESSRKLISKNWFNFFLLTLVVGLIAISGILLLGVGMVFTLPASSAIMYVAFKDITGYGQSRDEEDDILHHLIQD